MSTFKDFDNVTFLEIRLFFNDCDLLKSNIQQNPNFYVDIFPHFILQHNPTYI